MNTPINDGGPAFPRASSPSATHFTAPSQDGMTLRDYAEIHFISAWIGAMAVRCKERGYTDDGASHEARRLGVLQANDWLEARNNPTP